MDEKQKQEAASKIRAGLVALQKFQQWTCVQMDAYPVLFWFGFGLSCVGVVTLLGALWF